MFRPWPMSMLIAVFVAAALPVSAQTDQQVYGRQLMTKQEQMEYQQKMRAAPDAAAREEIRAEHHKAMQERAKQQGITLPDQPPARGGGAGRGMGPGGSMGQGSGMGAGQGMGPGGGMGRGMGPGGAQGQ